MKKTILFTVFTIICLTIPSIVLAETILINPLEMTSPEVGQTLTLDIKIEGSKGLFGFEFDLSYNPEFLKFVSATEGDFLQSAGQTFAVSPLVYGEKPKDGGVGTIRMGVSRLGGAGVNGDGVLAQVEFEVIKEPGLPILLEFQKFSLYDVQANKKAPANMVGSKIIPRKKNTPWDVNDDGQVDISDLVLVGRHFGETIEESVSPDSDVNNDGTVDISDLVLVGKHFGESTETLPAAPLFAETISAVVQLQAHQSRDILNVTIKADIPIDLDGFQFDLGYDSGALKVISVKEGELLRASGTTYWHVPEIDAKAGKIFNAAATRVYSKDNVLSEKADDIHHSGTLATLTFSVKDERVLLQSQLALSHLKLVDHQGWLIPFVIKAKEQTVEEFIGPRKTRLMQNYPNPFNPETWIPYQLQESAEVVIRIYDAQGRLVRTLGLGQRAAGFYLSRTRSAHWDGHNNTGEKVASGVYFYQIKAGDFSAARKMLIVK